MFTHLRTKYSGLGYSHNWLHVMEHQKQIVRGLQSLSFFFTVRRKEKPKTFVVNVHNAEKTELTASHQSALKEKT